MYRRLILIPFLFFVFFCHAEPMGESASIVESPVVSPSKIPNVLPSHLFTAFEERKSWLVKRGVVNPETSVPKYINDLIYADSPYLLSHALQPVNWIEWQPSFDLSFNSVSYADFQSDGKLIFISIGYSTCHWCHVMAEESFANVEVAKILNASYINIKVDREQWPLVDERFKSALELLQGEAGWPLNVILTPEGKIVWIDSYLNKDKFSKVMQGLAKRWQQQPQAITDLANRIDRKVNVDTHAAPSLEPLSKLNANPVAMVMTKSDWRKHLPEQQKMVYQALINDKRDGEPRFFRQIWQLGLLDEYLRTGNKSYLEAVESQLNEILLSPVYDAIDGGFHRYTVDSQWQVPHFEKMLYTQANMITLLAKAYGITGKQHYRIAMEQTIGWVELWLKNDVGYASAVSAISEGIEGKYYHFNEAALSVKEVKEVKEVKKIGVDDADSVGFTFSAGGGTGSLVSLDTLAVDWRELPSFQRLKTTRLQSEQPDIDEKVIVSWNSRYAIALLDAYEATDKKQYIDLAVQLLDSLWQHAINDEQLFRIVFHGRASIDAQLEDYALFATAQLRLAFYQPWYRASEIDADKSGASRGEELLAQMFNKFESGHDSALTGEGTLFSSLSRLNKDGEQASVYSSVYRALSLGHLYSKKNKYKKISNKLLKSHYNLTHTMVNHYSFVSLVADELMPARLSSALFAKGHGRVKVDMHEFGATSGLIADIHVMFELERGWHVNAHSVLNSRLIPTTVTFKSSALGKSKVSDVRYPKAMTRKLGFSDDELALYEGRFEVILEGIALEERDVGSLYSVDISVQACSDRLCLLPEIIRLNF